MVQAAWKERLDVCRGSLGHMQAASEKLQRHTARISDEQHLTELASLASAAAQVCAESPKAVLHVLSLA